MPDDLGLDITRVRTLGRATIPVSATVERELTMADLALLSTERGIKPKPIVKIRDSHHTLAKILASGIDEADACLMTGYSLSRISILKADPTFANLVRFYRQSESKSFFDMQQFLQGLSADMLQELKERFEDNPEEFSNQFIADFSKVLLDRTGHGPQTKSQNVNVNVELASRLERARDRLAKLDVNPRPPQQVIDVEPEEPSR